MKNIVFLETAEDVLFAFSPTRMQGDKFPYVGNDAKLTINNNGCLEIIGSDINFEIDENVGLGELLLILATRSGVNVVLPPHLIFDIVEVD